MPKIFIISTNEHDPHWGHYVSSYALAEDGTGLASHISTNKIFARFDMGLTSDRSPKRKVYAAHYPDGYELVDLVDATDEELHANIAYRRAVELNHADTETQGEPNTTDQSTG